jgi:Tol biopolymer transport system component
VRTGRDQLVLAGEDARTLDWSPDGRRLVYATYAGAAYVMNADGSSRTPLRGVFTSVDRLSWSPDGSRIAYTSFSKVGIFIYSFDTGSSTLLGAGWNPAWSPDGTRILFTDGITCTIWVMGSDGSNPRPLADLTHAGTGNCWSAPAGLLRPVWSPDARQIAVIAFQSIFVMRSDGTHVRHVTDFPNEGISWQPVP